MGKTFISGYKKRTQFAQNVRKCVRNLHNSLIISVYCGENRIRTCEPLLTVTRFPGVPLQPLEHLSVCLFWWVVFVCGCKGNNFFCNGCINGLTNCVIKQKLTHRGR